MVLDLVLMAAAFAAARSGSAGLMSYSFGLHFLAALTVSLLVVEMLPFFVFDAYLHFKQSWGAGMNLPPSLVFGVP